MKGNRARKASRSADERQGAFSFFLKNPTAVIALFLLLIIPLACLLAPILSTYDYAEMDTDHVYLKPCREHLLGTDSLGRDTLSRLLYGGRSTLKISMTAVGVSILGIIPGVLAGYFGGWIDMLISRADDLLTAIPAFLLAIFCEGLFGWGSGNYRYALGIALMPHVMKMTRNLVQDISTKEYVEAARLLGTPTVTVVFLHILRNIFPSLLVFLFKIASDSLLLCSVMGYLGIGINPPEPEWGNLVRFGFSSINSNPLQVAIPCVPIVLLVLALNIIGNTLRDALSPGGDAA